MFADDQVTSIRLLCLMLAAAGAYCLWWPNPKIGNIFQRAPLPRNVARLIGWVDLVGAIALFVATFA
jgi:NhaP-type Na+/H+ or K+/H+ antiporter